jgi:hypothetical protein
MESVFVCLSGVAQACHITSTLKTLSHAAALHWQFTGGTLAPDVLLAIRLVSGVWPKTNLRPEQSFFDKYLRENRNTSMATRSDRDRRQPFQDDVHQSPESLNFSQLENSRYRQTYRVFNLAFWLR